MIETNPIFNSLRKSPGMRIAVLFGSFFVLLIFTSIISSVIDSLSMGSERTHMLWGGVIQCLVAFCIPAFILARFSSNHWADWLELTKRPGLKAILGVIIVYLVSMPAMEWIIEWNANLHLPATFSSVETLFRQWEESSEKSTQILLSANGWGEIFAGVIVIGLLTGFSEELFFRGGLQGILQRTNMGKTTAVWFAAFIFSAMHFQFFGFIPRLLMGAFFGFLLLWTRSIWVPMFAHILNNSMVVLTAALSGDTSASLIDTTGKSVYFDNPYGVLTSLILTIAFLVFFRNSFFKSNNNLKFSWQKNQRPPVSEI